MSPATAILRQAFAVILLSAAVAKLVSPAPFIRTLRRLNVPAMPWFTVPFLESLAAVMIVAVPSNRIGYILTISLALAFFAAGAKAFRSAEPVLCACFGTGTAELGIKQLLVMPVAIVLIALLYLNRGIGRTGHLPIYFAVLTTALWSTARLARLALIAAQDRTALISAFRAPA